MTHQRPDTGRPSFRGFLFVALALVVLCVFGDAATLAQTAGAGNTNAASNRKRRRPAQRRARRRPATARQSVTTPRRPVTIIGTRDVDPSLDAQMPSHPPAGPIGPGREPVMGGVLTGKVISKPQPPYPPIAKAARAQGTVTVQIVVDEEGKVISAQAVSGHPLLQSAALQAARQARFSPTYLEGQPVKVSGVITYNFVLQ